MRLNATRLGSVSSSRSFGDQLYDLAGERPNLDLNFAGTKTLDPRVTFTRASSATYTDSAGVLQRAVTNLVPGSTDFSAIYTALGNVTVSSDATAAPDGSLTADSVAGTSSTLNVKYWYKIFPTTNTGTYTASIYLKANSQSIVLVRLNDNTGNNGARQLINLSTGALSGSVVTDGTATGASATINSVGNGWYRCTVTCTFNSALTGLQGPSVYHDGYATSTSTNSYFAWGAQLEQSSTVGEYVPTGATINSAPRFDHNPTTGESLGLLVEEARTNLLLRSEEINDTTYWARVSATVTPNAIAAPNGTLTADLAVNSSGLAVSLIESSPILITASSTRDYYATIYAKKGTSSTFTLNCYYNLNTEDNVNFNFDTGGVGGVPYAGEYIFEPVGNGWYRCGYRITRDATGNRTQLLFRMWHSGRGNTSGNTYFWGAHLDAGVSGASAAFPTSYIPTTTATVTRAADVASITGSNFGTTRTNLSLRSEEFDNASWVKASSTVTANTGSAPDGTTTADTFTRTTTGPNYVTQNFTKAASAIQYTYSIFAKQSVGSFCSIRLQGTYPSRVDVVFNLSSATISTAAAAFGSFTGPSASITPYANGWFRLTVAGTSDATVGLAIHASFNSNGAVIDGNDSVSNSAGLLWGAMLETGSTATAYIPTTTAAVSVFESSWYNQTEGTVFVSAQRAVVPASGSSVWLSTVSDGTANNRIQFGYGDTSNGNYATVVGGSVTGQTYPSVSTLLRTGAFAYGSTAAVSYNGGSASQFTPSALPTVNQMAIGSFAASGVPYLSGTIKRLTFWPKRLADTTLQQITQP
jgi:hypothetical protein